MVNKYNVKGNNTVCKYNIQVDNQNHKMKVDSKS